MSKIAQLQGLSVSLTTPGTAQRISASTILSGDVSIQAKLDNDGPMIIGASNVLLSSGNGKVIYPGDSISLSDLFPNVNVFYDFSDIWFDGETTGNTLNILYTRI